MIRIITDSTADLPHKEAQSMGVTVIPLTVSFGETHYRDGIDLAPAEFYDMLENAQKLPTTSQPSPELFLTEFEAAKQAGDEVVCILLSGALSGTCQSAEIARMEVDYDKIYIVDSKNATLALGLLVRRGVERMKQGFTAEEIVADLEKAREHLHLLAVVDTLTYLRKGGRLSGAAAVAGGLLGIKPVVSIDSEGKLGLIGKARGLPGAYLAIFKQIDTLGSIDHTWPVMLGYTGQSKGVEPFVRYIMQNLHMERPTVNSIGAVIGTHAGPGACGIAFFDNAAETL